MAKTHFPRVAGNQWTNSFYDESRFVGDVYYVGSAVTGATDSSGYGRSPEAPFATLGYATATAATANNGDLIIVLPGHAETITGAAGIALSKAGVTVRGLGVGRNRPIITFGTNNAASCDISAANCTIENLVFVNAKDGQTAMVNVTAADVSLINCELQTGDATTQAVLGILTSALADRLLITGCYLHGLVTAGTTSQISLIGGDGIRIVNNILYGSCATTGNIAAATTAVTNFVIDNNRIMNQTADANNKTIVLGSGDTGIISNNRMSVIDSTSPAPVTAAGAYVSGNYWTGAAGVTASTLM